MDSRHITTPVPELSREEILPKIFSLQKELIEDYIKIEKGLPYPLNVNTKTSQSMIKDFTSRVVEELAEGYESLLSVNKLTQASNLWLFNYNDSDLELMASHLQNANEEFADALHFMVELMIYVNLDPTDVVGYIHKYYGENTEISKISLTDIEQANIVGGSILVKHLQAPDAVGTFNPFEHTIDLLEDYTKLDHPKIDTNLIKGGRYYNKETYLHSYKEMLWDITYSLNLSRNFLRNKPWKQSQVLVDEQAYQEEVVKSFIMLLGFFSIIGLNPEDLFYIYFKKNQVNRFRIKSKY